MKTYVTLDDWRGWRHTYSMLPYVRSYPLPAGFHVLSWEKAWKSSSEHAFVLESGKAGTYTFLGLKPIATISGSVNGEAIVDVAGDIPMKISGKPLDVVKGWLAPYRSPRIEALPKWVGGIAGYWGYDVVRSLERLPSIAKKDLPCPDYYFMMMDKLWIIDHDCGQLYCAVHALIAGDEEDAILQDRFEEANAEVDRMKQQWDQMMEQAEGQGPALERIIQLREDIASGRIQIDVEAFNGLFTEFSKENFMSAVNRIQDYIRQGDVFQVNLSVRQSRRLASEPEEIYEWLRYLNPSPYMSFMKFPGFCLVCGSPELLVQLEGDRVRTRPIAGTRPRGLNAEEDAKKREELLASEKERAEHIMLVDLERNDLGKVSRYGTVRVDELMTVELYSHVMHIVSEVTGELMPGKDAFDVISATFPGGTITGAPKIRTMEIIEELEPTWRGPYTGSIGWIDYNGNMEFNIIIRTLLAADGIAHVQAGAGIVIDSDASKEYTESLNKAKALWKAVQYASDSNLGIKEKQP